MDQSTLSADFDTASDYDILEIIMSYSETYETIVEFYKCWINLDQQKDKRIEDDSDDKNSDSVFVNRKLGQ